MSIYPLTSRTGRFHQCSGRQSSAGGQFAPGHDGECSYYGGYQGQLWLMNIRGGRVLLERVLPNLNMLSGQQFELMDDSAQNILPFTKRVFLGLVAKFFPE